MAATAVTLSDFQGHSPVAGLFKCNPSNIYAAFYTDSTDSVLAILETRKVDNKDTRKVRFVNLRPLNM